MTLVNEVYSIVKFLPKEETYALSDQMRRSAVSIPSNIAEGRGRQTTREFSQFLYIARGSLYELETQLLIAVQQKYVSEEQIKNVLDMINEIEKMISKLTLNLKP